MKQTVVKRNTYQDSINLMLLTNKINSLEGVVQSQIMMGTDANKDIFNNAGLLTDEAKAAGANDMVIVIECDDAAVMDTVLKEVDAFLSDLSVSSAASDTQEVSSWADALDAMPDANLALFSTPGEYTAPEIEKALDRGLHVFSFSDNISLDDEVLLKKKAHEKGLLLMGPDCGTGVISSVPIAFTNVSRPGNIGVVGASGTGIQEVCTLIDKLGGGVVHAIGTGGRDLSEEVGAITTMDAIRGLEHHDPTDVICVISKPPAKKVRDAVVDLLQRCSKPAVAIFLGEKPTAHEGSVYLAHTLEETAQIAVDLALGNPVKTNYLEPLHETFTPLADKTKTVVGLYSGGTLANEAGMLISEALELGGLIKQEGYVLHHDGYDVIDLGDDKYTQGKPHPMIDPEVRIKYIRDYASRSETGVILFDCMLGYGSHPDMAGQLAPVIKEQLAKAQAEGRELYFVGSVTGTEKDPQNYEQSIKLLKDAGALVESSNTRAVRLALAIKGIEYKEADKPCISVEKTDEAPVSEPSPQVVELLNTTPRVINVGVKSFGEALQLCGAKSVQFNWKPVAGGNKRMIHLLNELDKYAASIDEANNKVVDRLKAAQPFLIDVVPAKSVIPELNTAQKTLLHAGPPMSWDDMTSPMKGSCIGAALFEGWADNEDDAVKLLSSGEVRYMPCHHAHAVGPMGGITSANMAVLIVENKFDGTRAYCTMNEGIGKVLRFGAYNEEVVNRLHWMADVLGPVMSAALKQIDGGINLNVVIAKAITMGDEFHQRNIAASLNLFKELVPEIAKLDIPEDDKQSVIRFLADTDQFFLNVMMATGKAMVDSARTIKEGCVVTTMTRNGKDFGIRIAALGDEWFVAPVNLPRGLYFTGFTADDGNPDIGDSAITETIGVGAMTMIAAPAVTRFVGAGGFDDALAVSNDADKITVSNNPNWTIPTWNFKGAPLGIDIRKVVETGITPTINTGIAHKKAGIGQVGAGTVHAPLACFEKALEAYCASLGIK